MTEAQECEDMAVVVKTGMRPTLLGTRPLPASD
jgi:hypothetical protein